MSSLDRITSSSPNGSSETAEWLVGRGLCWPRQTYWQVKIVLEDDAIEPTTKLDVIIEPDQWGFRLVRLGAVSSIRVIDAKHICERDDFCLRPIVPPLRDLRRLIDTIEARFAIELRTADAKILSTLPSSENKIRFWVAAAL